MANILKGGILLKLLREIAYQCLILMTILGLVFVAFDLSTPAAAAFDKVDEHTAVKVFSSLSQAPQNEGSESNYYKNVLLPFGIYLLSCCGFMFLILENIRLWKTMNRIKPVSKLIWAMWIFLLGLMGLLPVYLGTSLIFEGLWYILSVMAILLLFYWTYWVSQN